MHISKVTIRHWRGLEFFEAELSTGLNLVRGRNEAGKSSVVEAISWALHRDVVGTGQIKGDIAPIIPAGNPKARPCVELVLEFPDCSATVVKTLAEEASGRTCALTLRRKGLPDIHLDQEKAQNELHRLIGAGAYEGEGGAVDVPLLVSTQGKATDFVGSELSGAARSGVVLGHDGTVAASARLEKVRRDLEKRFPKHLQKKLKGNAVDSAVAQTEAARAREGLLRLREEHAHYCAIEAQITDLRRQIGELLDKKNALAPALQSALQGYEELRLRREAQLLADGETTEKKSAFEAARAARDEWQRQCEEVARLRGEAAKVAAELGQVSAQLETARTTKSAEEKTTAAAWEAHLAAEKETQEARRNAVAWERYQEVSAAHRDRNKLRKQWEAISEAQRELAAKTLVVEKLERAPTQNQLNSWHRLYHEVEAMKRAAAQTLQITLRLERDTHLTFQADGGAAQESEGVAGEEIAFGSQAQALLKLAGVGEIAVASAGREAQKQDAEIESKLRTLEKDLKTFGFTPADLPGAFEIAQSRLEAAEAAGVELQACEQKLANLLDGEEADAWKEQLEEAETAYEDARQAVEEFRSFIPEGTKASQANIEREKARVREEEARLAAEGAQREWLRLNNLLTEAKNTEASLAARLQSLEQIQREGEARLLELTRDGLDEKARNEKLEELRHAAYRAQEEVNAANVKREALGEPVDADSLGHMQYENSRMQEDAGELERELVDKRASLRAHCEQDPQSKLDSLDTEITGLEAEMLRHEARLRGMAILRAALEAQRHSLGRAIAAPLNAWLSPWLSELRERPTKMEFDENTGKLMRVQTTQGENTFLLPFDSHSAGMQEQTALVLRLILALSAARRLPGQRLPLVLDDPLTQTDSLRRDGIWKVLNEAGQNLQIVYATCHEAHLPAGQEANVITVGPWEELPPVEKLPVLPTPVNKSKRKEKTTNGNGHVEIDSSPQTLSLW